MKRGEYVYHWLVQHSNYFPKDSMPTEYDIDVLESLVSMIRVQHINGWLIERDREEWAKRKPAPEAMWYNYPMGDGGRKAKN